MFSLDLFQAGVGIRALLAEHLPPDEGGRGVLQRQAAEHLLEVAELGANEVCLAFLRPVGPDLDQPFRVGGLLCNLGQVIAIGIMVRRFFSEIQAYSNGLSLRCHLL